MPEFFKTIEFNNWTELKKFFGTKDSSWCFRGQPSFEWKLTTSMDRVSEGFSDLKEYRREFEQFMIRNFRRNPHLYSSKYNIETDFQVISLLQHFGAPTRLLDFTFSPYVAAFFAIESPEEDFVSIFALNYIELLLSNRVLFSEKYNDQSEEIILLRDSGNLSNVFDKVVLGKKQFRFVDMVQPFYKFDRLIQQQGLFLCQGDLNVDFEANLYENYLILLKANKVNLLKIKIPKEWRNEMLTDLNRMNIHFASLFPGLEGHIKSLKDDFDRSVKDRFRFLTPDLKK